MWSNQMKIPLLLYTDCASDYSALTYYHAVCQDSHDDGGVCVGQSYFCLIQRSGSDITTVESKTD